MVNNGVLNNGVLINPDLTLVLQVWFAHTLATCQACVPPGTSVAASGVAVLLSLSENLQGTRVFPLISWDFPGFPDFPFMKNSGIIRIL